MIEYNGKSSFEGIGIGRIHILKQQSDVIFDTKVSDIKEETNKFESALEVSTNQINELLKDAVKEQKEILEVHLMMINDPDFLDLCYEKLNEGYNASYSVFYVRNTLEEMLKSLNDEYMSQRANDVKDISSRIINVLNGVDLAYDLKEDTIIYASDISPSELLSFPKDKLKGIVTFHGSLSSHVAIISRSMSLPLIVNTKTNISDDYEGRRAIVDGFNGIVIIEPEEEVYQVYQNRLKEIKEKELKRLELIGKENVSLDGKKIDVFANIGSNKDAQKALTFDAGGIGLFRSEFIYLDKDDYPSEEYQFNEYKKILETMEGRTVIIRTMDIGADKQVKYFDLPKEENPALGLRSLRICLKKPHIMKTQLRALYKASAYGNLKIMVPMIISKEEVLWVKQMAKEVMEELTKENIPFNKDLEIGIMIETPAAAIISDDLAKVSDFFSIGTNDLTQYTLAVDRQNQNLEDIFDTKHKAILRLIKLACENAHKEGIWCGICGELARNTDLTEFFLTIGIDELSVSSPYVLKLREKIRSIDTSKVNINKYID